MMRITIIDFIAIELYYSKSIISSSLTVMLLSVIVHALWIDGLRFKVLIRKDLKIIVNTFVTNFYHL
jgi:hypothetical protein